MNQTTAWASIYKGELTPEQVEAALDAELREAKRPKGTVCGTVQEKDLGSKGSRNTG